MIQRIQSIYLAVISILLSAMMFFPLAEILSNDKIVVFNAFSIVFLNGEVSYSFYLILQGVVIALLSVTNLVAIFLYSNRKLQMMLCKLSVVFEILLCNLIFYNVVHSISSKTFDIQYSFPIVFPIIALILQLLAFWAIRKDDRLIRSVDRIR